MCALRKAAMCLCTWQLFLAQAEQLPGALLHHAARPACLLGTRVTTTIPPNCPGTNTLPRALIADIALPIGCESAAQTARNPSSLGLGKPPHRTCSIQTSRLLRPGLLANSKEHVVLPAISRVAVSRVEPLRNYRSQGARHEKASSGRHFPHWL